MIDIIDNVYNIGDRLPVLSIDTGEDLSLASSVSLKIRKRNGATSTFAMTISGTTASYAWGATDFSTLGAGLYDYWIEITFTSGKVLSKPRDTLRVFKIVKNE